MSNDQDNIILPDTTPESMKQRIIQEKLSKSEANVLTLLSIRKENRQVPEAYFVAVVLPIMRDWFRGIANPDVGVWLNIADGQYRQIDVIDDDSKEFIYRAPSAYVDIPPVVIQRQPGDGHRITLADIVDQQAIALENGNERRVMEIEASIGGFHHFSKSAKRTLENIRLLTDIYLRYELPVEELFGEETTAIMNALYNTSELPPSLSNGASTPPDEDEPVYEF